MNSYLIFAILAGTPWWVYALFAYLLWQGLAALRPTNRSVLRVLLVPVAFIAWGLCGLSARNGDVATVAGLWLAGALAGGLLGWLTAPRCQVDPSRREVRMVGSALPLFRNTALFGAHYLLRVEATLNPAMAESLMRGDLVVSGLSAGYFIAWLIRFARQYHRGMTSFATVETGVA